MLSTAFGRSVDVQKGESTEIIESVAAIFNRTKAGNTFSFDSLIFIFSKFSYINRMYVQINFILVLL